MSSWNVVYSSHAREDLAGIYNYVKYTLQASDTAIRLVRRIMNEIQSLDEMPLRYLLFKEEPWHKRGLRFFSVGNYVVLYKPQNSIKSVNIVRIIYGGRDIPKQLSEDDLCDLSDE